MEAAGYSETSIPIYKAIRYNIPNTTLSCMRTNFFSFAYTGYTQKNGVVSVVKTIETAPFFCEYPVYVKKLKILTHQKLLNVGNLKIADPSGYAV